LFSTITGGSFAAAPSAARSAFAAAALSLASTAPRAVHHAQRAFHFPAEVAVARRIYDVDLGIVEKKNACYSLQELVMPRSRFQVVRIHHTLDERLVGAENPASAAALRRPAWVCRGPRAR